MSKNIKQISLTFSPKALLSCRPGSSLFRDIRVLFSLGFFSSKTDCHCLPVVLSKKEKNYINFRVLHTKVKLFNSFTCKTTYSLLVKELLYIRQKVMKTFNMLSNCLIYSLLIEGKGFLRLFYKNTGETKITSIKDKKNEENRIR